MGGELTEGVSDAVAAALTAVQDRVVERAAEALAKRQEPHYEADDALGKLRRLFDEVKRSVERGDAGVVARYCEVIARDRLRASFDLSEVQSAFNALEEAMWSEAVASLPADVLVDTMVAVHRSLGAGRDALARAYVASAGRARLEARDDEDASSLVDCETVGRVGVLTLRDEPKRNALSSRMAAGIIRGLDTLAAQDVRAVVLRAAAGAAVWSSGHDIGELPRGRRDPLAYNDPLEQCVRAVRSFRAPVIAMVHGSVWGGAFDLVLSCDVVIADETATFAITPANLGLPYNTTGLLHFLGRMPVNVVKEMFFTATPIDARQAERWLVVNHLLPAEDLERFTMAMADTMTSKAPLAITAIKEQLRVLTDYQPIAAQVYERIQGLRREAYDSSDYVEGLAAFAEKRPPSFRGR